MDVVGYTGPNLWTHFLSPALVVAEKLSFLFFVLFFCVNNLGEFFSFFFSKNLMALDSYIANSTLNITS